LLLACSNSRTAFRNYGIYLGKIGRGRQHLTCAGNLRCFASRRMILRHWLYSLGIVSTTAAAAATSRSDRSTVPADRLSEAERQVPMRALPARGPDQMPQAAELVAVPAVAPSARLPPAGSAPTTTMPGEERRALRREE
jgi:hypothetical protein